MRRTLLALAAAGALLFAAIPAADAYIIGIPNGTGGCSGKPDVTYDPATSFYLKMLTVQLPRGPASNIYAQVLFKTNCQPKSGTAYWDLQLKQGDGSWAPQIEVTRDLGALLPKGWALYTGGAFCSGRHTWRAVLTWHGTASDGTVENVGSPGIQYPSGKGEVFNCINYGG